MTEEIKARRERGEVSSPSPVSLRRQKSRSATEKEKDATQRPMVLWFGSSTVFREAVEHCYKLAPTVVVRVDAKQKAVWFQVFSSDEECAHEVVWDVAVLDRPESDTARGQPSHLSPEENGFAGDVPASLCTALRIVADSGSGEEIGTQRRAASAVSATSAAAAAADASSSKSKMSHSAAVAATLATGFLPASTVYAENLRDACFTVDFFVIQTEISRYRLGSAIVRSVVWPEVEHAVRAPSQKMAHSSSVYVTWDMCSVRFAVSMSSRKRAKRREQEAKRALLLEKREKDVLKAAEGKRTASFGSKSGDGHGSKIEDTDRLEETRLSTKSPLKTEKENATRRPPTSSDAPTLPYQYSRESPFSPMSFELPTAISPFISAATDSVPDSQAAPGAKEGCGDGMENADKACDATGCDTLKESAATLLVKNKSLHTFEEFDDIGALEDGVDDAGIHASDRHESKRKFIISDSKGWIRLHAARSSDSSTRHTVLPRLETSDGCVKLLCPVHILHEQTMEMAVLGVDAFSLVLVTNPHAPRIVFRASLSPSQFVWYEIGEDEEKEEEKRKETDTARVASSTELTSTPTETRPISMEARDTLTVAKDKKPSSAGASGGMKGKLRPFSIIQLPTHAKVEDTYEMEFILQNWMFALATAAPNTHCVVRASHETGAHLEWRAGLGVRFAASVLPRHLSARWRNFECREIKAVTVPARRTTELAAVAAAADAARQGRERQQRSRKLVIALAQASRNNKQPRVAAAAAVAALQTMSSRTTTVVKKEKKEKEESASVAAPREEEKSLKKEEEEEDDATSGRRKRVPLYIRNMSADVPKVPLGFGVKP